MRRAVACGRALTQALLLHGRGAFPPLGPESEVSRWGGPSACREGGLYVVPSGG